VRGVVTVARAPLAGAVCKQESRRNRRRNERQDPCSGGRARRCLAAETCLNFCVRWLSGWGANPARLPSVSHTFKGSAFFFRDAVRTMELNVRRTSGDKGGKEWAVVRRSVAAGVRTLLTDGGRLV
jgi:hypothetical protein